MNFINRFFSLFRKKHHSQNEALSQRDKKHFVWPQNIVTLKNLPFTPVDTEILFVQEGDDAGDFIKHCIPLLEERFAQQGLRIVYLPSLHEDIAASEEIHHYWRPSETGMGKPLSLQPMTNDYLLQFLAHPEKRHLVSAPALWVYLLSYTEAGTGDEVYDFFRVELDPAFEDSDAYREGLYRAVMDKNRQIPRYRICGFPDADEGFEYESERLLYQARMIINRLRCRGVSEVLLAGLLEPEIEPSRLHITSDYRILLSDYNDKEVKMTPLVKSVFLLFLRHPEGILFKELSDYADELADLYDAVRGCKQTKPWLGGKRKLDESVSRLVDPTDNSINEKCARIREAFLLCVHEQIASNYFITGKRGEPKRILLPQDKVVWD